MAIKKDNTDGKAPADRAGLCWRTFSRNQRGALRVELRSGRIFILPYMHWGHAHLEKVEGIEELTIHFNSHEVRVEGQNLKELLLELQAANVELLREIPQQFVQISNGVIIHTIQVSDGMAHQPT
jgi:hypothetical protein